LHAVTDPTADGDAITHVPARLPAHVALAFATRCIQAIGITITPELEPRLADAARLSGIEVPR